MRYWLIINQGTLYNSNPLPLQLMVYFLSVLIQFLNCSWITTGTGRRVIRECLISNHRNSAEIDAEINPVLHYLSQSSCRFLFCFVLFCFVLFCFVLFCVCVCLSLSLSCYSAPFLPPSDVADGFGWHKWLSTTCCRLRSVSFAMPLSSCCCLQRMTGKRREARRENEVNIY